MFIIAGVSPRVKTLDSVPRLCPVCGLAQAYLKRIDHYLSLFFIPILRVKKGEPVLICERCERNVTQTPKIYRTKSPTETVCPSCGRALKEAYSYCPYCGRPNKK